MPLDKLLGRARSIFIDTAPIIYFIEAHPKYGPLVKQLVEAFSAGRVTAFTSVITLAEVLPAPLQAGNVKLARKFTDFLKHGENLTMIDISAGIAENAGRLRAEYPSLKAFDAMQLAAAMQLRAKVFVTNDKKLKNVKGIEMLVLDEYA